MALKLNVLIKDKPKSSNAMLIPPTQTNQDKQKMFDYLRELGFKYIEKDGLYILKLEKSDAIFVILHNTYYKVCLWCYEEAYEYKREPYGHIDTSLTIEQLIFKLINK